MADQPEPLPKRAEALLTSFPVPEHDFDAQASAIEQRVRDVPPGTTEATWLQAPFPDSIEEERATIVAPDARERGAFSPGVAEPLNAGAASAAPVDVANAASTGQEMRLSPEASALPDAVAASERSAPRNMGDAAEASVPSDVGDASQASPLLTSIAASEASPLLTASAASEANPLATAIAASEANPLATAIAAPEANPLATAIAAFEASPLPTGSTASETAPASDSSALPKVAALANDAPAAPVRSTSASAPPPPSASGENSLAALARSVAQKGPRPQSNDIAKESFSVAAAARAHTDVIVERVRGSRPEGTPPPPSSRPPPPLSTRPSAPLPSSRPSAPPPISRPSEPLPSAPSARPSEPAPSQPPRSRDMRGPWLAVAGIGFAAAAVILFIGRSRELSPPPSVTHEVREVPARAAVENDLQAQQARVAKADSAAMADTAVPVANEDEASASAPTDEAVPNGKPGAQGAAQSTPGRGTPPIAMPQRLTGAKAVGPKPAGNARPPPEAVVLDETPSTTTRPGAQGALRPASGGPSGGLPEKPSTGAVQAALGSVMAPARACLAGTTAAAPAQVTFGSDGSVKSANVTGPTAGSPAASCIEGALRRARVAPFAAASFSLGVWVRP